MHHSWRAREYQQHSSIQYDAAKTLLGKIQFSGQEKVLDVGCGDGKISAMIAEFLPKGYVLGIDISPEMISFAKMHFPQSCHPNLDFSLQNAQELDYDNQFDIVFSSFAIQWVQNKSIFLKGAYRSLKPIGSLVLTIPLGISEALAQAVEIVKALPKWSSYFQNFCQDWHFVTKDEFAQMLRMNKFAASYFEIISHNTFFSSLGNFKNYVLQWFPYLRALPESMKESFFNEVIDEYLLIEPVLQDGKIAFNFLRMDIIAHKVNP